MTHRNELTIHPRIKEYLITTLITNRVQLIRENSDDSHWMYVKSKPNAKDPATLHGLLSLSPNNVKHYINGLELTWKI